VAQYELQPGKREGSGDEPPSAAYGEALMERDNKVNTLDLVEPTNRHRNARRQARLT
jgi:hypothetical protein